MADHQVLFREAHTVLTLFYCRGCSSCSGHGRAPVGGKCRLSARQPPHQQIRWATSLCQNLGLLWPWELWGWGWSAGATVGWLGFWKAGERQVPGATAPSPSHPPQWTTGVPGNQRSRDGGVEALGRLKGTIIYKRMPFILPSLWPSISKLFLNRFFKWTSKCMHQGVGWGASSILFPHPWRFSVYENYKDKELNRCLQLTHLGKKMLLNQLTLIY